MFFTSFVYVFFVKSIYETILSALLNIGIAMGFRCRIPLNNTYFYTIKRF